jgi:transcriptional regulator with XRE-family HTH domain
MPQEPLPLIITLKRWREQNDCSQSDAVKVLTKAGIPVTLDSVQNWKTDRRRPGADIALALADFLRQPNIAPNRDVCSYRGGQGEQ